MGRAGRSDGRGEIGTFKGGSSQLRTGIEIFTILVVVHSRWELMVHTGHRRSIGTSTIGFRRRRSP
jgi:hypothetical protein